MLYKFDILFKKVLKGGGLKAVSYHQLLAQPNSFGEGETLEGAVGTMSLIESEKKKESSSSSLFMQPCTPFVGYYRTETLGKDFPLFFTFSQPYVNSIRVKLREENGYYYPCDVNTFRIDGTKVFDLRGVVSFLAIVPQTGFCTVSDSESEITLHAGELALIPAYVKKITIQGTASIISIKPETRVFW